MGGKSSVHRGNDYRLRRAKEQSTLTPTCIEEIIKHTKEFLKMLNMPPLNVKIDNPLDKLVDSKKFYAKIKSDYGLESTRDIVWMKFTADGFLRVVTTSDDINFDMPHTKCDYNVTTNGKGKSSSNSWKHNSSGILIHMLDKEWNKDFVLVFPLAKIPPSLNRRDIECGIGNYLIYKGIPILDYYSHRF